MFYFRCTVDPVLFENFLTEDGDLLRAKFQAFKFPETNFVLFKGIVNVCLDKCRGVSKPFYDHFKIATNFKYRNASSSFSNIFCCFFVNLCRRFRYGQRYLIFMALEKMSLVFVRLFCLESKTIFESIIRQNKLLTLITHVDLYFTDYFEDFFAYIHFSIK